MICDPLLLECVRQAAGNERKGLTPHSNIDHITQSGFNLSIMTCNFRLKDIDLNPLLTICAPIPDPIASALSTLQHVVTQVCFCEPGA